MGAPQRGFGITGSDGTFHPNVAPRVHDVSPPASYPAGGHPVDLSGFYTKIIAAVVVENQVTATGIREALCDVTQAGTDTYANAKFRVFATHAPAHTHQYDKPNTPTGNNSADSPMGAGPHNHALAFTSTATGTPSVTLWQQEVAAGTNFSNYTWKILVWGVPK